MGQSSESFIEPHTLTILCTYQCTAACKQCCFESSPKVVGRLSRQQILDRITEAKNEFSSLRLVVFSGGEAFLLKQDLFDAVAHANSLGLLTRIVSNGSWAKTPSSARKAAAALKKAGLNEINISTGLDHQQWVPRESVINAAEALAEQHIFALVTVELDNQENSHLSELTGDPRIKKLMKDKQLTVQSNSWMPFHSDAGDRSQRVDLAEIRKGCSQVFGNIVVTPHDNLSACCGLTLEHIPEMRLGRNDGANMGSLYRSQAADFLKFWIHVDGPYSVIERLLGEQSKAVLQGVVHVCQACVLLHKNPDVRKQLEERHQEFVPEVMTRFFVQRALEKRMLAATNDISNPETA